MLPAFIEVCLRDFPSSLSNIRLTVVASIRDFGIRVGKASSFIFPSSTIVLAAGDTEALPFEYEMKLTSLNARIGNEGLSESGLSSSSN